MLTRAEFEEQRADLDDFDENDSGESNSDSEEKKEDNEEALMGPGAPRIAFTLSDGRQVRRNYIFYIYGFLTH